MDPVLLDILLDSVTKYLTGTTQTQYIVGINRKKKPDYWDKICEVRGDTPDKKEHDYWQLQRKQDAIGWDNFSEASLRRTGGSSMGGTKESKMNINKNRRKYKTSRKKNNQGKINIKLMSFRGYSKQ